MKKILISLAILVLPLPASAETLYGFIDHHYYNVNSVLQVFGFLDGRFYNIYQQQVWPDGNGNFTTTNPQTATLNPDNGVVSGSDTTTTPTPVTNILIPQPAVVPPVVTSSTPVVLSPIIPNICPNIATSTPTLPAGMIISGGNCVSDNSGLPFIDQVSVKSVKDGQGNQSQYIQFVINSPVEVMPKIEYSVNPDMSSSSIEKTKRDQNGNSLDGCYYNGTDVVDSLSDENLTPGTTYYFRVKAYQCDVPVLSPWQLFLGQTDINNFTK